MENKEELIKYAKELGVENVSARNSIESIRIKINERLEYLADNPQDKNDAEDESDGDESQIQVDESLIVDENLIGVDKPRTMVKIKIHKSEGSTGSDDVPVSVNGRVFIVKRGVEVDVPDFVVEALSNAVRTDYESVIVGEDVTLEEREVLVYQFSILK